MHEERDDDDYYDPEDGCMTCNDEGSGESACIDDLCHGGDVPCLHGDYRMLPCFTCGK